MARFEDTEGLFGSEMGSATNEEIICGACGQHYPDVGDGSGPAYEMFGDLTVCECCFEMVEKEILRRMPQIIAWYTRILKSRRGKLEGQEAQMRGFLKLIQELPANSPLQP